MKKFKHWKGQEVQETFDLQKFDSLPILDDWLNTEGLNIEEEKRKQLQQLQTLLKKHALDWNEAELKFHFLSPFILLVNYHSSQYNPFVERALSVKIGEETATGIVDFLIAQGEQIPKAPYFCLHEYKPEEGVSNDPFGQLLIAMVAAQQANEKEGKHIPIYGAFIIGRNFYFVVLDGKQYAVSDIFTATQSDIFDIYLILQKVKKYILQVLS